MDAILARFEDRILEILTTHLDAIVTALDVHSVSLDDQQEILDRLVIQSDDRSSSSSSEDLDDTTPTVSRCEQTPSTRPINDHQYMPFVPSRHDTWASIRPFLPSATDGIISLPPVGTPAPSFGSSNPFADDLAPYLAPLQRQTIREYIPGGSLPDGGMGGPGPPGGRPPGGVPPGRGIGGPGPPGGGWWHGHYRGPMVAGLAERPAKYSGKAGENAKFWFQQLDRLIETWVGVCKSVQSDQFDCICSIPGSSYR